MLLHGMSRMVAVMLKAWRGFSFVIRGAKAQGRHLFSYIFLINSTSSKIDLSKLN